MTREEIENSMTLKDAIEVFKSTNAYGTMDIAKSVILKALEQKPCEDAISRQDTLKTIIEHLGIRSEEYLLPAEEAIYKVVKNMPPVTPQQRWIPVSERLPKPFSYVNCTCRSLIDDRAFWVVETCYVPQPKNSPYSDWGNIPMLNHGDCAVVAWMYREIPKPYKAESEV